MKLQNILESATLDQAKEWQETNEQFCFCIDLMGISAHTATAGRWVDALEDKFEELLRAAAKPVKLTKMQKQLMFDIAGQSGQLEIATSEYSDVVGDGTFRHCFATKAAPATIRGLEKKGLIRIIKSYWRGMTVELVSK